MSIDSFLTSQHDGTSITFDFLLAKVDEEHQNIKKLIQKLYDQCNTSPKNSDAINRSITELQVAYTSLDTNIDKSTYTKYEDAKNRIENIVAQEF